MSKKLLYLNIWDDQKFKDPWRRKMQDLIEKNRHYNKRNPNNYHKFFEDIGTITSQFLKPGQDAVEIFSWCLPAFISFIKSEVGKDGRVYSIDGDPDCEYELFINFISMYESLKKIESGVESDSHYHTRGTLLKYIKNKDYIAQLGNILSDIDTEYAKRLATDSHKPKAKEKLLKISRQFYDMIGIEQLTQVLPPYPEKLGDCSIDAIFEHNGFPFCYEEQKEKIITGADRILRPGGHIVFKDIPRELVAVQYYGEDIFNERFTAVQPTGLNYPNEWLVLRKER